MDRGDLATALAADGVRSDACDLFGTDDHPIDAYVLRHRPSAHMGHPDRWIAYYSERGQERGLRDFATEDAACRYLLAIIRRDDVACQRR